MHDPFSARDTFHSGAGQAGIYRLTKLEDAGLTNIAALPYSIRVLLESVLRNCDGRQITEQDVRRLAGWQPVRQTAIEVPFKPARVVLQDFTGVPAVVDLAAMRSAMKRLGGDPKRINPLVPVDLVIDHSVQVDRFGSPDALAENVALEFQRNRERYEFLRWGQQAFSNFRVVPPSVGIIHQVNLEFLAKCVFLRPDAAGMVALPDTLVGTDSHTTMINGLGVVGWGVGGIEAEAVMLGQPLYMLAPEVIGFELRGELPPGATATDLVLTVTQILRKEGVVDKFVEFCGPALANMNVADRALVANMAPEYGATMGFFPTDEQTLSYLRETGRSDEEVALVERYTKEQQLFRSLATADASASQPRYTKLLQLDLTTIEPSLAGPKRPQDRVPLGDVQREFRRALQLPIKKRGFALSDQQAAQTAQVAGGGTIGHGAVVIASITSCTNTSNPAVMLAAGLLARNAVAAGIEGQAAREDQSLPGQPGGDRLSRTFRAGQAAGAVGLSHGRLRLHDVHRQQRPAAGGRGRGGRRRATGGRGGTERQPQLRGPHQPAGEGQLPGQPAVGRGLRAGRHGRYRLDQRTAGRRQRRPPGVLEGYLAQPGGNRGHGVPRDPARDVPQAVRQRA